ncbi:HlyD family secretion protein [Roseomonas nepalensis]|uniref:HlyD family secretion protein n=1 Tax=Muricoccus nepalensis TaxID=1854500 RepID=A0A502FVE6_9PROT|nr:HlyD family secretion protein [Roseomonas nepalensis]TPG53498.1 HlyD family secretion protein [Roseomonas nepalensis]
MADGDSSAARRDLLELEPANRSRPEGEAPAHGKTRREGDADDRSSRKEDGEGDAKGADKDKDDGKDGKKGSGKRWPLIIGGVVLLVAILAGGWYWWSHRDLESTDDAYTEGRAVTIAPRVGGYVTELAVNDNQMVKAGDLLLRIDARDYTVQRDQARAQVALARTQLRAAEIDLDVARVRAPAQLAQAEAQRASALASQEQARADERRQRAVDPRATTQSNIDTATAALRVRTAAVAQAEAEVQVASVTQQTIDLAAATVEQRRAAVTQAEAQLAAADLNLSYTEIRAPQDGRVTRRNVERGGLLQPGTTVMNLVTPEVWVAANFKENQLARMRPGQPVEIEIDAFPDMKLRGHIDSVQMGSGARFSAFPSENATGNFVKIVRRVPVKIVIDSPPADRPIPLGLSVVPTVTVE